MKHLIILSICWAALALHGQAWAQIYETRDAEGNPEFTDSPPSPNAKEIDLQQTNIVDAPAPGPQAGEQPAAAAPAQVIDENNVQSNIEVNRDGDDDGLYEDEYVDDLEARELRREEAVRRADPDAPHEVMLVLDGSTGQNALEQAKHFTATTDVTALAITKLDGTAKGGVVLAIANQFKIPVKFIGVGEKMEDLLVFDKHEFVDSLFSLK